MKWVKVLDDLPLSEIVDILCSLSELDLLLAVEKEGRGVRQSFSSDWTSEENVAKNEERLRSLLLGARHFLEHLAEKEVLIRWWSGMYSFQVACANNNIKLIDRDWVHVPPTNTLSDNHYICHYSCDNYFNKKKFPRTNTSNYPKNKYYDIIKEWLNEWEIRQKTFKMFL